MRSPALPARRSSSFLTRSSRGQDGFAPRSVAGRVFQPAPCAPDGDGCERPTPLEQKVRILAWNLLPGGLVLSSGLGARKGELLS